MYVCTREWIAVRMKASSATQTKRVISSRETAVYVAAIFHYRVKEAERERESTVNVIELSKR